MNGIITTITLFRYETLSSKLWAFKMMNEAHGYLKDTKGLKFYRLMGTGRSGFNPFPNWAKYALIMVWENEKNADDYLNASELFKLYTQQAKEYYTMYLSTIRSVGVWSGANPFESDTVEIGKGDKILVLTRASIKWRYLFKFWKYVPYAQKGLKKNAGLIFTMGIGEAPLVQMCTLSLWQNTASLNDFAYQQQAHQKAISMTRAFNWYKEELFARFVAYRSEGTWHNQDLIKIQEER